MEFIKPLVYFFAVLATMLFAAASLQTLSRGGTIHGVVIGLVAAAIAAVLAMQLVG